MGQYEPNGARLAGLFGEQQQELMELLGVCLSRVIPHVNEDVPPEPSCWSRLRHGEDYESISLQRECHTVLPIHLSRLNQLRSPRLVGHVGKVGVAGKGYPIAIKEVFDG